MYSMNYKKDGQTFVPELQFEEKISYGEYGQLRLEYLKEYRQDKYTYYLMHGALYQHLAETDVKTREFVEQQVKELQKKYPAPDQNDILAWTGYMNNLKQMAEEVAIPTYITV